VKVGPAYEGPEENWTAMTDEFEGVLREFRLVLDRLRKQGTW
jgi:hypothetical protein